LGFLSSWWYPFLSHAIATLGDAGVTPEGDQRMRKAGLTHRQIEAATAPPGQRRRLSDWPASPLYLAVSGTPSNHKSWLSRPRVAGRQQTLTHGSYPAISLQIARERARAVARAVAEGATDRARLRAIARGADPTRIASQSVTTVEVVTAEFITRHLHGRRRAPAYIRGVEGRFRNHILPNLGKRDIRSITRREIVVLLDQVHDHKGPAAANLTLACLRKFFRWARERELVEAIPTEGIAKPGEETKRERVLEDSELELVMRAARRLGYPYGTYTQLLVFTALRRGELAGLRWREIDPATNIITIPAQRMKARRTHVVPMVPAIVDLLAHCPHEGLFVLGGSKPLTSFLWVKQQLDRLAPEIAPWTLHDLRRSVATSMARLGIPRFIVARVLAHTDREITATYDRHQYEKEKKSALEKWAAHVTGLLAPQPVPEVAHGR
jgi:integrase